ncbi:MAG TPA: PDZ domain-containing protein [Firmicutes bacterium]|nr:PDZ domain-containing protein [Bacillota bacterium]
MYKKIRLIIVIFLVIVLGFLVPTGYYIIKPGSADDLSSLIQVEGKAREEAGGFFMMTVAQQPANLWSFLYGAFHPLLDLRPISRVIPPDMTSEEYSELMQNWMQDSKYLAQIIALRRAGYEVPIVSEGVEIVDLIPGSPVEDILKPGDIIRAVEGDEVNLAEELVEKIQEKEIGENILITVQQGKEIKDLEVVTAPHIDDPQKAALCIYVRTLNWQPVLPMEIKIETGPVIGPSAGLMFVLEIFDRLVPENLTGGHKIAGTGTISLDEKVGGIGGVKQKVAAAERESIEFFLVPEENYEDALQAATKIEVVSVAELEDALDFLYDLSS